MQYVQCVINLPSFQDKETQSVYIQTKVRFKGTASINQKPSYPFLSKKKDSADNMLSPAVCTADR